jgi:type II secretory pathway pseudopilin PulG
LHLLGDNLKAPQIMKNQQGMTLLVVLFMLVVLGLAMGMTGMVWKTVAQRDREKQLLWVGNQYRLAIESYYSTAHAGARGSYPAKLEDLLRDPRSLGIVRHIRRLYKDPMTGRDFKVIRAGGEVAGVKVGTATGGIMGVVSTCKEEPFKKGGFPEGYKDFENATTYQDWQFVFKPSQQGQVPQAGAANRLPAGGSQLPGSANQGTGLPSSQPGKPLNPPLPGSQNFH